MINWRRPSWLSRNFRDSCLDQLANDCGRQTSTSGEPNRSPAGIVAGQILLECRHCVAAHGMKRTVVRSRFEAGNELPVQAERGHSIADGLLRLGCRRTDGRRTFCSALWFSADRPARYSSIVRGFVAMNILLHRLRSNAHYGEQPSRQPAISGKAPV
jgi:hypothetical protein